MSCFYCEGPIQVDRDYRRVLAWEKKASAPSRQGGSDVVLREPRDVWACWVCIDKLKRGISVGQETLA